MAENGNPAPLVVICGPTASGKTALGVDIALRFDGEIVSADSRQVYRGLDIGTGKDRDEYVRPGGTVPCHMIDIADPDESYSLYRYMNDFHRVLNAIRRRRHLPVMVGGTGLYIEAVLKGYDVPAVPEDEALRKRLMQLDRDELERRLHALDPERHATTDLSSKKRIVRSLEIALSGRCNPDSAERPVLRPLVMAVSWPRDELVERIDRRLNSRLEEGMVDEVRGLLDSGISAERLIDFGMEYRHVTLYCLGKTGYGEMVENLKTQIHRLAKRQMTWFRGMERRGIEVNWLERADRDKAFALVERLTGTDNFCL